MANTLKLGAGKWATGTDTVLAFNDANNNFKPLPFDFSRASSATVVNQSGLIETVGSGTPRIDFLGNTKGALLLEPQRANKLPWSNKFTNWSPTNVILGENSIVSPDGTLNATKITDNATSGNHRVITSTTTSSSGNATYSIFLKKGTMTTCFLNMFSGGTIANTFVDLENGTISGGSGLSQTIEPYGNGWYKVSITGVLASTSSYVYMYVKQIGGYIGNGDYMFMYGAQLEEGSYATSYIPTSGSAVTRVLDACSQTVPDGVIGQTEGVVYIDFLSVNNFDGSGGILFEIKEDNNNRINIYFSNGTPRLFGIEDASGVFNQTLALTTGSVCKLAIKYNSTSTKVFINGSLSHTLNGINNIAFSDYSFLPNNNINYNEIKLYNTALTDQELIALTTI